MLNAEYYKNDIIEILQDSISFGVSVNKKDFEHKIFSCDNNRCDNCIFKNERCTTERVKWLLSEKFNNNDANMKKLKRQPDTIIEKIYETPSGVISEITNIYKTDY